MGTKNASTTSTQSPPSWVSDAYKGIFNTVGQLGNSTYTPYTGGYTPDQQQAFQNIRSLWGASDPTFQQANQAYQTAQRPTYETMGNWMSPYVDDVVKKTMANMNELNGQQQQQVVGNAISKGAWGGDRVGVAQSELARQQSLANNQTIAGLYQDAFQQALSAAQSQQQAGMQTAAGLTNLGQTQMNANLGQTAAQLGAGTQQQQFDYSQYLNQQGYPFQKASWMASLLGGIGPLAGGTTTGSYPAGNWLSQLLGLGTAVGSFFADGGVVRRAGGGGVMPYPSLKDSPWGAISFDGSPYSNSGDFGAYLPGSKLPGPKSEFPEELTPLDGSDNPFNLEEIARRGGKKWFADGGKVSFADLGRPQSSNIEDRRDWANGDDPLGDLIKNLGKPRARFNPFADFNIEDFNPLDPTTMGYEQHFGTGTSGIPSRANGGVVPHLASGGYPRYSPGYNPSDFYTGTMSTSLPFVQQPGSLPSSYRPPSGAVSTNTNSSVIGNGTLYDAQNDPRFPISSAYVGGWGTEGMWPVSGVSAPSSGISPAVAYSMGQPAYPGVAAITAATDNSGVLLPRPDPRGYLTFNGPTNTGIGGDTAGVWGGTQSPGYGPAPGAATSGWDSTVNKLGTGAASHGWGKVLSTLFPTQWNGIGSWMKGLDAPAAASSPHVSDLTGATPKVAYHSKPITHDYAPVTHAGQRTDIMGNDMAFMPTSVQTSSRWNTGYANGGVIPHMASGGSFNFDDIWGTQLPDEEKAKALAAAALARGEIPYNMSPGDPGAPGAVADIAPSGSVESYAPTPPPAGDYGVNPGVIPTPSTYQPDPSSTPFAQGQTFMTNPDPQYSQNIGDVFHSLAAGKGLNLAPDVRQAILAAGAGMMASHSPFALQGVGEGIKAGIDTWANRQALERENAKARADLTSTAVGTIPLTQAQTGLTTTTNAATRFTFSRTPAGVMVTDAQNPGSPARFVPWGGILPDGSKADPNAIGNGTPAAPTPLFSTEPKKVFDPRLMSPDTVPLVTQESGAAIADARAENIAANSANQIFEEMKTDVDRLPKDGGLLTQGTGFNTRLGLARGINTGLQALGLAPAIPEDQVAAGEDLNKLTFRLGGELSKGIGSNAASIIMDSVSAVPSGMQSREGADRIIAGLQAMNQRKIDYYVALQKWQAANSGSTYGFDEYFNSANPPELYAMSAYVPRAAMEKLMANPNLASDFNEKYGNGRDVARYVLRR